MRYEFAIGTSATADIAIGTVGSMMALYKTYEFGWDIMGAGDVTRTRNILATRFLKANEAQYLIYIDRDLVFKPTDVGRLLEGLRGGYDLIGGCYIIKSAPNLASSGNGQGNLVLDGTVQEVKYLASGFMGVTRTLLEKMVVELDLPVMHKGGDMEAYPFFEQMRHNDPDWGDMWLSEDYDFCAKARQVGVKSYLDTSIRLGHLGNALWRVDGSIESRHRREISVEGKRAISEILKKEALLESERIEGEVGVVRSQAS